MQTIPFAQLRPSARNVRKSGGSSIDDLAASIAAHGLLQNLTVEPAGDVFEVVAGGRRLAALTRLVDAGTLSTDFAVPCLVVDGAAAHEASLAENVIRQAMHPADEFEAFAKVASDGHEAAAIAERFGVPTRHVEQRLKLANVAPELLQIYRAGKADLEQMMALALTDDHDAQRRAWKAGERAEWKRSPRELRGALTTGEIAATSKLAQFVGVDEYEAAGGFVRRDMFGTEQDAYLADGKLLRELAQAKLQKTADRVATRDGWAWTEARVEFDYTERSKFKQLHPEWKGSKEIWADDVKAAAGAVVTIGFNGQAEVVRGLQRPGDRKAPAKGTSGGAAVTAGKADAKPAKKADALSFAQVQRLQGHRSAVLRVELAKNPRIALAALAADLARVELFDDYFDGAIVRIREDNHVPNQNIREQLEAALPKQFTDLDSQWRSKLKPHRDALFAWLLQEPEATTCELLAFLAARSIVAGDNFEQKTDRGQVFAHLAGVDMAEHWQVTEEWLAAQPKAYVLAAVAETSGKKNAELIAKLKKSDLARRAAELIIDSETGPGARARWLPKPLRAPRAKAAKKAASEVTA